MGKSRARMAPVNMVPSRCVENMKFYQSEPTCSSLHLFFFHYSKAYRKLSKTQSQLDNDKGEEKAT
jgi:hypothetical protein